MMRLRARGRYNLGSITSDTGAVGFYYIAESGSLEEMAVFRPMIENLSVSQKDLCKNTFANPIIQCYIFIKNVWLNCVNPVERHTFFILWKACSQTA